MTALDILSYCATEGREDRFLNITKEELQPHLDHIVDPTLAEVVALGVGFYHEAMDRQDKRIVEHLFDQGAIQLIVASKVSFACRHHICFEALTTYRRNLLGVYPARRSWW